MSIISSDRGPSFLFQLGFRRWSDAAGAVVYGAGRSMPAFLPPFIVAFVMWIVGITSQAGNKFVRNIVDPRMMKNGKIADPRIIKNVNPVGDRC